jgi:hypothetical protein
MANDYFDADDPRRDAAAQFVARITGSPDTPMSWQLFDDSPKKDNKKARVLHGPLDDHFEYLRDRNDNDAAGVFVTINETNLKGRTINDIVSIRAIMMDDDEEYSNPGNLPLRPHLMVQSSKLNGIQKKQNYWVCTGGDREEYDGVIERLTRDHGNDPGCVSINRVLRVPGFYHQKDPNNRQMVEIIYMNDEAPYSWEEIKKAFPPIMKRRRQGGPADPSFEKDPVFKCLKDGDWILQACPDGKIHIRCPFESEHEQKTSVSSTTYFMPNTNHYKTGHFKCHHGHCAGRTDEDFLKKIGFKKQAAREWGEPHALDTVDAPGIPPNILPEVLRNFCTECAESMQVPFELPVMGALGATATAAAAKYKVLVTPGYHEPLNLYLLATLRSGERKSGALEKCRAPLVDWQEKEVQRVQPEVNAVLSEIKTRKKAIEKLRALAGNKGHPIDKTIKEVQAMEASLPEEPALPWLFVDDTTPEAVVSFLSKHNGRACIMEAEGGIFEIISGLYSGGKAPNLNIWLKGWSGEAVRVSRRTREDCYCPDPAITFCLLVQPSVLTELSTKPGFRGRGFLARFLFCLPKSRLGYRSNSLGKEISDPVMTAYTAALTAILEKPWAIDSNGKTTYTYLYLGEEARQLYCALFDFIEPELKVGGKLGGMTDWAGKLPGEAVRIAGLFHLIEHGKKPNMPKEISHETMERATLLSVLLLEHAREAFEQMGDDPAVACAKRVLNWVQETNTGAFSVREAHRVVRGDRRFKKAEAVRAGIHELEERGYIRQVETDNKGPGRPKSPTYEVNPAVF